MIDNAHEPGTAGANVSHEGIYQGPSDEKKDKAHRAARAAARQLGESLIDEAEELYEDIYDCILDSEDVEYLLDLVARDKHGQKLDAFIRLIVAENGLPVPDDDEGLRSLRAAKTTDHQFDLDATAMGRQVYQRPSIPTVKPRRYAATRGAKRRLPRRSRNGSNFVQSDFDTVNIQAGRRQGRAMRIAGHLTDSPKQ